MRFRDLRTDHLKDPMGYALHSPVFTWTAESTGVRSLGARVTIARDEAFTDIAYDSGMSPEVSPLGFRPPFTPQPCTRYWWRVEGLADDGDRGESDPAWFETAEPNWQAKWIAAPFDRDIHPVFRKTFTIGKNVRRARVYVSGLGLYALYINGERVGEDVLAPFYNDYRFAVQYQTYDIAPLLREGENTVTALLGGGWYKGRFSFVGVMRDIYGDTMQMIAQLHIEYDDGSGQTVATGEDWQCRPSPILESGIYDGETRDARLEDSGAWENAVTAAPPQGKPVPRFSPPLGIRETIRPVGLIHTPAGEQVLDFGQVMTGWAEFDCELPEGTEVKLEYGELLQKGNFFTENLDSAKQTYRYISNGKRAHVVPLFTYFGFRYVKVTGMEVRPEDFAGRVVHSDLKFIGEIETSDPRLNRLFRNALWGQRGNFLDVPTDCPQRDERMGWTGDAQVFAPTATFNMYTPAFYAKYMRDMLCEQRADNGAVPYTVPDAMGESCRYWNGPHRRLNRITDMSSGKPYAAGSCAWGDAATVIPWTLYTFCGDKGMLEEQYESMRLWVDWIRHEEETKCGGRRLWLCGFHFADWLALDNTVPGSNFGGTDNGFVATVYYYYSSVLTAKAARALGRTEDAEKYSALAEEIRAAFRQEFFTPTGRIAENTQTAMVLALYMDLVPDDARERLIHDLREKLRRYNDHLCTGFVGTYFIARTLTKIGRSDLAYTLLLNEDYPGWLYAVNMGATTIWERWNSLLPDGTVSDTGMNSMNHYSYGSIVEWMYRCMCGLNPDEEVPGFRRAILEPHTDPRLTHAKARYDSAMGLYECGWTRTDAGIEYDITVPFDCEAVFRPDGKDEEIRLTAGKWHFVY